ncbi:MAG: DUF1801 domain-containing protein [Chitinophagaceae bacterium]|nr:MAG: DUF1801 domain-containing protein [Chitinophagaceae bacterium]
MASSKPQTIDDYMAAFPQSTQQAMQVVRDTIHSALPGLEETISYAIPAFKSKGKCLVYFAGYKTHVGMYPVPTAHPALSKAYEGYKTSGKGAVQFPLNKKMPVALIKKTVKLMYVEQLQKLKG